VATVARKFMHDRHMDLYLGRKRVTILASAKTAPQYLRRNFNYEALGIKANSARCAVVMTSMSGVVGSGTKIENKILNITCQGVELCSSRKK